MIFFKRLRIIHFISRPPTLCTILTLLLQPVAGHGQDYQCQWAHVAGNTAMTNISSQDVNSSGNVYVTGNYLNNNLSFDNSVTVLNPNPDTATNKLFLAKYSPDGHLLWAKGFESGGAISGPAITIDNQDNIYLTGYFSNYITFGTITLTQNPGSQNAPEFLAKFDSAGNVLWAKQISISSAHYEVNDDGRTVLYGAFSAPSVALGDNLTLTNSDNSGQTTDFLIAELDNNGHFLWAKSGGVPGKNEEIDHVAFTPNGQVYVSGLFESTLTFDGITLSSTGNTSWFAKDWFLARYDVNGNVPWAIRGGISLLAPLQLMDGAPRIKTDQFNNLYFLGIFHNSTMQVDSLTLNGVGDLSDFLSTNIFNAYWYAGMCNEKGLLWAISGNSPVQDIYFTPANDTGLYLTGMFNDTAIFGNITLNGTGPGSQNPDGFVVKLDRYGQVSWAKQFGPLLSNSSIFDMVVDRHNTLDILGAYGDPKGITPNLALHFDSLTLNSVDASRDYYLARYKSNGDVLSASDIGSPAVDGLTSGQLDLAGASGLYVSGGYSGMPLTLDTITINFPVPNLNNYFVARYDVHESTTGTNTITPLSSLCVFPNPTTGLLGLRSPVGLDNIEVFNVSGQEVYHRALPVPKKECTLNLTRLPNGIYWLKVNTNEEYVIRKIVLKR